MLSNNPSFEKEHAIENNTNPDLKFSLDDLQKIKSSVAEMSVSQALEIQKQMKEFILTRKSKEDAYKVIRETQSNGDVILGWLDYDPTKENPATKEMNKLARDILLLTDNRISELIHS